MGWLLQSRSWKLVVAPLMALLVLLGTPPLPAEAGDAGDTGVTVQIVPAALNLEAGEALPVEVIATNGSTVEVTITSMEIALSTRRLTSTPIVPSTFASVPPRESVRARFEIRAEPGLESGEVAVLAGFSRLGSEERRITVATVKATGAKTAAVPEVAFVMTPERLNDGQTRAMVARITNPTPFLFQGLSVVALSSDDVNVTLAAPPISRFVRCATEPA